MAVLSEGRQIMSVRSDSVRYDVETMTPSEAEIYRQMYPQNGQTDTEWREALILYLDACNSLSAQYERKAKKSVNAELRVIAQFILDNHKADESHECADVFSRLFELGVINSCD